MAITKTVIEWAAYNIALAMKEQCKRYNIKATDAMWAKAKEEYEVLVKKDRKGKSVDG